jgi:hypothetical protein
MSDDGYGDGLDYDYEGHAGCVIWSVLSIAKV